ncbi:MAG: DUF4102 domain-containing protein [Acidimicrobiia bacterium]|nr:DUF4102 domain-containing protein [Acidimicrobiia bacterium]
MSAAFVRTVTVPGKYGDQHGLILRVTPSGSKQWIWRGTIRGKRRDLGLGGYPYTSLAEARQRAFEYRKLARQGGDPTALRRDTTAPSFAEACEQVISMHEPSWKDGGRSSDSWRSTLSRLAYPRLGDMPIADITSEDILAVVGPVWQTRRETARKLKGRISAVMAWAIAEGHRPDDPTAAVMRALPRNNHQVQHHRALPHADVAAALATVRASGAWAGSKLAFAFLVLTAGRSGEVRGARWNQVDEGAALWTVPAEHTKNARPHRVPLSEAALEVLGAAKSLPASTDLVFPSPTGRQISNATMGKLLRQNGIDAVPHGFRSSFRDWCGETGVAREVAEACLAHTVANATEAAYARSDLLARRRDTMDAWGKYLTT